MSKVRVPQEMAKAAYEALGHYPKDVVQIAIILTAALEWLTSNPIVPTEEQCTEIANAVCKANPNSINKWSQECYAEFQRRMFTAPDEDEAIRDLLWKVGPHDAYVHNQACQHNQAVREAHKRGMEARK